MRGLNFNEPREPHKRKEKGEEESRASKKSRNDKTRLLRGVAAAARLDNLDVRGSRGSPARSSLIATTVNSTVYGVFKERSERMSRSSGDVLYYGVSRLELIPGTSTTHLMARAVRELEVEVSQARERVEAAEKVVVVANRVHNKEAESALDLLKEEVSQLKLDLSGKDSKITELEEDIPLSSKGRPRQFGDIGVSLDGTTFSQDDHPGAPDVDEDIRAPSATEEGELPQVDQLPQINPLPANEGDSSVVHVTVGNVVGR
ncbi:hypothetical protein Dimus_020054 [Dionaea muscipula]